MLTVISVIPVIKEKPRVVKIVKKKTVVVECHVLSQFAPDCTWFKENQAVKEDSRHKTHVEQVKEVSLIYNIKSHCNKINKIISNRKDLSFKSKTYNLKAELFFLFLLPLIHHL